MLMYIYWSRFLDHTAHNHITAIGLTLVARLVCVGPKSSYFNVLLYTSSPHNTCNNPDYTSRTHVFFPFLFCFYLLFWY